MTYLLSFRFTLPLLFFVVFSQSVVAGLIRDTELETGLQKLAAPLLKAAGFAPNSIDFRIIIDSSYNAFVAGKMAVYLHSGLLLDAKSPEEILGVIAHEIGHLASGHAPLRQEAVNDANLFVRLLQHPASDDDVAVREECDHVHHTAKLLND